jgi:tetratricopeptide (TPR) repeat protein
MRLAAGDTTGGMSMRCHVVGTPISYGLGNFKNRIAQRAQILGWVADPNTRLITIYGRRGIGKSSLVAKVVEMLADSEGNCSGVVNLSTRTGGPVTVERIFFACAELADADEKRILSNLWSNSRDPREKILELFAAMGQGTHVIVLDNIEDQLSDDGQPKDSDLSLFLDVVFRAPRAPCVIITTQVPIALDPAMRRWEARLNLNEGLPLAESVDLLRELDRNGDAGLLDAPQGQLEEAAVRLHGVPRALELTVGALAEDHLTLPTLKDLLEDFTARGDIVDQLAHSRYRRLDDEARMTLDVLAVFSVPVTREAVEWVLRPLAPGLDPARALSRLAQVHMLSVDRRTREFALHPLDADIAYGALPSTGPTSKRVLERRVADWYGRRRQPAPWSAVTDVINHRHEYEHRLRAGDYDSAALVIEEIGEFLIWHGSVREVLGMHLALKDHVSDDQAVLACLVVYGQACHIGGPVPDAVPALRQAIPLAEKAGNRLQLWRALYSLGDVYRILRKSPEAIEALSRAAALAREFDDPQRKAFGLLSLSLSYTYAGSVSEALEAAEHLHVLAEQTEDPVIRGQLGDARSSAYIVARRWADAINAANQAVAAYAESSGLEAIGYARNLQGIALLGLGRVQEAIELLNQACAEGNQLGTPRAEGLCRYNLAWAYWLAGDPAACYTAACEAVEAFRRSGGDDIETSEELGRAAGALAAGDLSSAESALRAAAAKSEGNSDFTPASWLLAEADRLAASCDNDR